MLINEEIFASHDSVLIIECCPSLDQESSTKKSWKLIFSFYLLIEEKPIYYSKESKSQTKLISNITSFLSKMILFPKNLSKVKKLLFI
jgi:hypothetical protein